MSTSSIAPSPSSSSQSLSRVHACHCYHCDLPVVDREEFTLRINDQPESFCCIGCLAITSAIYDGGLEKFYQYRSEKNHRPEQGANDFSIYDNPDIQREFVYKKSLDSRASSISHDSINVAYLLLDDITCAACVWLIEKRLTSIDGVKSIRVNASNHQCQILWDEREVKLSALMHALCEIGYRPQPLSNDRQTQQQTQKQRMVLMRLGVAAFGMMQVGMVAIALYAGALQGMDQQWVFLLRWVSLLVATPVVLFSAQPFWKAAWRSLKQKHLTMEVPVSLAIILAYLASIWATIQGTGEVYFDSVSMFTFFLLLGRYLEMRTRYRNQQHMASATRLLPIVVQKVQANHPERVDLIPLAQLQLHDCVLVNTGDTIPCDGEVIEGQSAVVEALLTGEAEPVQKKIGDAVIAGTVNTDGSLLIKATAVDQQTRLSTIEKLVNFAQQDKPKTQVIADKVASVFVAVVLVVATAVFTYWWNYQPEHALWVTLSVLVVTCPCALSLATPTVLTATVAKMRQQGLLVLKGHVIESLTHISHVVFDKTGTLTYGEPTVVDVQLMDHQHTSLTTDMVLAIVAALEDGSSHPIAKAFAAFREQHRVRDKSMVTGSGVRGNIDNRHYVFGKPEFVMSPAPPLPSDGQWLLLASDQVPLAWIRLSDGLRSSAKSALDQLQQQGLKVEILSGDNASVVKAVSLALGNIAYQAGVSPEQKLHSIQQLQQKKNQHNSVLMVGDGINDVPVLAGANVSVAMDTASDFARTHADTVLLNNDLTTLPLSLRIAHRCKKIIRQNIAWALLYNVSALPLAAAGFIPPYLAALGMSLSSLIVVVNALRV